MSACGHFHWWVSFLTRRKCVHSPSSGRLVIVRFTLPVTTFRWWNLLIQPRICIACVNFTRVLMPTINPLAGTRLAFTRSRGIVHFHRLYLNGIVFYFAWQYKGNWTAYTLLYKRVFTFNQNKPKIAFIRDNIQIKKCSEVNLHFIATSIIIYYISCYRL